MSAVLRASLAVAAGFVALGALAGCGKPQELECAALEKSIDARAVEHYQVAKEDEERLGVDELREAKRAMGEQRKAARQVGRDVGTACRLGTLPPALFDCYHDADDVAEQGACDVEFTVLQAQRHSENEAKKAAAKAARAAASGDAGDEEGDDKDE